MFRRTADGLELTEVAPSDIAAHMGFKPIMYDAYPKDAALLVLSR